jgi:hypothetical protein
LNVGYNIVNWQWTWGHVGDTALNLLGAIPGLGKFFRGGGNAASAIRGGRNIGNIAGGGVRKLTRSEQAMRAISEGQRLTTDMKNALRADARRIMQPVSSSGGRIEIHHRIPLEYSHLFRESDPNAILNLVGVQRPTHIDINRIWTDFRRAHPKSIVDDFAKLTRYELYRREDVDLVFAIWEKDSNNTLKINFKKYY